MNPAPDLHTRLKAGKRLFGTFALADSPVFVEMLGMLGFDFVVIDCEHSATAPFGPGLEHLLRAADAGGVTPWVRVRSNDFGHIGTALDLGAQGVVVPHVKSAEDMRKAVSAAAWPPLGRRGAAPVTRAARYGVRPWHDYFDPAQPVPLIGPLIEDPEGVDNIDTILDVEGVGMVWFGHFDLGVALGKANPLDADDEVEAARQKVHAAAEARSVPIANFAWNAAHAHALVEKGAQCVAVSTDISLWLSGLRELHGGLYKTSLEVKPDA